MDYWRRRMDQIQERNQKAVEASVKFRKKAIPPLESAFEDIYAD